MQSTENITAQMLNLLMLQQQATSEQEAKKLLKKAKRDDELTCVGGRIIPPDRQNKRRWLVQTYYEDTDTRPPHGMARLSIPNRKDVFKQYGITMH